MIRTTVIALALAAAGQESTLENDSYAMAWFRAHLHHPGTAKIELMKPPREGRRETGDGFFARTLNRGKEVHVVIYRCYRVSERADDGSYGLSVIYLMTEAPTGKMYEVKTSPRKVTFPGRGKVDDVVETQCAVR